MAPKKLTNYIPPKGEGDSAVIFIPTLAIEKKEFFQARLETGKPVGNSDVILTVMEGSGSDQSMSQRRPVSGTSHGLAMLVLNIDR